MSKLSLTLYADGSANCQSWLCLDNENRKITALTWDQLESPSQFELVAKDSGGNEVTSTIEASVVVKYTNPTHSFAITLDENYSDFIKNHRKQVDFYKKLRRSFPAGTNLTIESVSKGSVVVRFALSSEATENSGQDECPTEELENFMKAAFSSGEINSQLRDNLKPHAVTKLEFVPTELCEGKIDPVSAEFIPPKEDPSKGGVKSGGSLIIIIVVVVVVVVLIFIIIIVVVVVRKRQAKRAQYQTTGHIEKGVPRVLEEDKKAMNQPEQQALLSAENKENSEGKTTPKPPAYPENSAEKPEGYQPPTPPVSEPDEHDRSL